MLFSQHLETDVIPIAEPSFSSRALKVICSRSSPHQNHSMFKHWLHTLCTVTVRFSPINHTLILAIFCSSLLGHCNAASRSVRAPRLNSSMLDSRLQGPIQILRRNSALVSYCRSTLLGPIIVSLTPFADLPSTLSCQKLWVCFPCKDLGAKYLTNLSYVQLPLSPVLPRRR